MALLAIRDLFLHYRTRRGAVRAVDGVSWELNKGETVALVGESGCGKTSTASAILRMLPRNVAKYEGEVVLDGQNLMDLDDEQFRKQVRWRAISMVFQGAMNALHPMIPVGRQVAEPLMIHLGAEKEEAHARAQEAMESVGLPKYTPNRYAHELSGGMKQRVVIAMALVMRPAIVILDEPTSALDVMTQANIINLLKKLKEEEGLSYIFITHDLGLSSELADRVGIMYAGRIVEMGPADIVFPKPRHPYTQKLLASVPRLRSDEKPDSIAGTTPDLVSPPVGCRFHPRCPYAFDKCRELEPPFFGEEDPAACWLLEAGG